MARNKNMCSHDIMNCQTDQSEDIIEFETSNHNLCHIKSFFNSYIWKKCNDYARFSVVLK